MIGIGKGTETEIGIGETEIIEATLATGEIIMTKETAIHHHQNLKLARS